VTRWGNEKKKGRAEVGRRIKYGKASQRVFNQGACSRKTGQLKGIFLCRPEYFSKLESVSS
jgi:hypothetical protein